MTKDETIKVLAMLNGFYAGGKNDPRQQAFAWHLVLGKYDFNDAMAAVIRFAENDNRDYATFPAVGRIVAEIKKENTARTAAVQEVIRAISYGKPYEHMTDRAKALITQGQYAEWSRIDAMDFAYDSEKYADILRTAQNNLLEGGDALST